MLDLGCGGGILAESLAEAGCEVVGLDASLSSVAAARQHAASGGFGLPPAYVHGVGECLPFADAAFDVVVASESLEHVEDPTAVLRELRRVVKPDGVFCFDTPNRTWFTRVGLIWAAELLGWVPRGTHSYDRLFTPREFAAICLEADWLVEEIRGLSLLESAWSAGLGYWTRRRLGGFEVSDDDRLSFIGWAAPVARAAGVE